MNGEHIGSVYHYTSIDTVPLIMRSNKPVLRMTHAEDFEDRHEGRKTIEVYYDLALEQLLSEGKISQEAHEELSRIEVPEKTLIFFPPSTCHDGAAAVGNNSEYDMYISCFSVEKDSQYMFDKYIKNNEKKGYYIEFSNPTSLCNYLYKGIGKGYRFEAVEIMYGKSVVQNIYDYIYEFIQEHGTIDKNTIDSFIRGQLQYALSRLRYAVKLYRYHNENEIRLLLYIPKAESTPAGFTCEYTQTVQEGKRYVYVELPKYSILGLSKSIAVCEDEDIDLRQQLSSKGYQI